MHNRALKKMYDRVEAYIKQNEAPFEVKEMYLASGEIFTVSKMGQEWPKLFVHVLYDVFQVNIMEKLPGRPAQSITHRYIPTGLRTAMGKKMYGYIHSPVTQDELFEDIVSFIRMTMSVKVS